MEKGKKGKSKKTKLLSFHLIVLPSLLYSCPTFFLSFLTHPHTYRRSHFLSNLSHQTFPPFFQSNPSILSVCLLLCMWQWFFVLTHGLSGTSYFLSLLFPRNVAMICTVYTCTHACIVVCIHTHVCVCVMSACLSMCILTYL
jgi:hypothetical protein